MRRNAPGPSGLLVLRAGRRRWGKLTPLECLLQAVELREDEFAIAVFLDACGLGLRVCAPSAALPQRFRLRRTAALVVLLPADRYNRSAVGVSKRKIFFFSFPPGHNPEHVLEKPENAVTFIFNSGSRSGMCLAKYSPDCTYLVSYLVGMQLHDVIFIASRAAETGRGLGHSS